MSSLSSSTPASPAPPTPQSPTLWVPVDAFLFSLRIYLVFSSLGRPRNNFNTAAFLFYVCMKSGKMGTSRTYSMVGIGVELYSGGRLLTEPMFIEAA